MHLRSKSDLGRRSRQRSLAGKVSLAQTMRIAALRPEIRMALRHPLRSFPTANEVPWLWQHPDRRADLLSPGRFLSRRAPSSVLSLTERPGPLDINGSGDSK